MTNRDLKRAVRARMAATGENYTRALRVLQAEREQARLAREQEAEPEPGDVLHLEAHGVFSEGELPLCPR